MRGLPMLAQLIMYLCGDNDSWDPRGVMIGGMMGGMGMGGGGMGGMGGGGMGGMGGGGMRSVPPSELSQALLKPNQTRKLPTRLFGLSNPTEDGTVNLPQEGEKLKLGDIDRLDKDQRVQRAVKRLARDKAPSTVATMVMWNVRGGMDWESIALASKGFANAHELALAKSFVAKLDDLPKADTGVLLYEIKGDGASAATLAKDLSTLLKDQTVLGLKADQGVPSEPTVPAVACKVVVAGSDAKPEATVYVFTTDGTASTWAPAGKFTLPVTLAEGKPQAVKFADALAEGLLGRLVRAQLTKAGSYKGRTVYKIRIDNASPLILNGLAILGTGTDKAEMTPKCLDDICISPRQNMTVPASSEMIEQLGLRKGIRVIAADLSGL
jgi:hypothetical protein